MTCGLTAPNTAAMSPSLHTHPSFALATFIGRLQAKPPGFHFAKVA